MTPPATAAARSDARIAARRGPAPRAPRRVSGPAAARRDPQAASRTRMSAAAAAIPARPHLRLRRPSLSGGLAVPARGLRSVARAGTVDRILSGRGVIAVVAAMLIGLVFLQVTLLKVNAGIGRSVQAASTYERQNATLRAQISNLEADGRVTGAARRLGMVMPGPDQIRYLRARHAGGVGGAGGAALAQDPSLADGTATADTTTADTTAADPSVTGDTATTDPAAATDPAATDQQAAADPATAAATTGAAAAPGQ